MKREKKKFYVFLVCQPAIICTHKRTKSFLFYIDWLMTHNDSGILCHRTDRRWRQTEPFFYLAAEVKNKERTETTNKLSWIFHTKLPVVENLLETAGEVNSRRNSINSLKFFCLWFHTVRLLTTLESWEKIRRASSFYREILQITARKNREGENDASCCLLRYLFSIQWLPPLGCAWGASSLAADDLWESKFIYYADVGPKI